MFQSCNLSILKRQELQVLIASILASFKLCL
uniref:Uncharacterized protein n=1 Tax=Rhizophora mucronata TaxID=61149 RepID=A0A2P2QI04_RHIMU